jgi:hypothetical protein
MRCPDGCELVEIFNAPCGRAVDFPRKGRRGRRGKPELVEGWTRVGDGGDGFLLLSPFREGDSRARSRGQNSGRQDEEAENSERS